MPREAEPARSERKIRVHVPGADGWELPGGQFRVLRYNRQSAHPVGWWLVQEKGLDGEWFAHDGEWLTMGEAIASCGAGA